MALPEIDFSRVEQLINLAFDEDLSDLGDATSLGVIPSETEANAVFIAKDDLICCGLPVTEMAFKMLDQNIRFNALVNEGDFCPKGTILAKFKGNAQALLTGERTALNFIQRLCGIATTSSRYAKAVKGTKTLILDTRKTTPGWRNLEKYAVACGGAANHRIGLYDMVMIKDNHRELAGLEGEKGITRSVQRSKENFPQLAVEVEADTLDEVKEAVQAGAEVIMLDNMTNEEMTEAVKIVDGKAKIEASGGITIERIPSIAALGGIDYISVGALTHSVKAADISMDIKPE